MDGLHASGIPAGLILAAVCAARSRSAAPVPPFACQLDASRTLSHPCDDPRPLPPARLPSRHPGAGRD